MTRYQEFELETYCAKLSTAMRRFKKKYPAVYEVWQGHLEWMIETGHDFEDCRENGYIIHAESNEGWFYIDIIIVGEHQIIKMD